jgi:thiol-disulfide isomerase/thioredoxin
MSDFVPRKVLGKFMHVTDISINRPSGKCLVFFMGAEFCPFCAAERWAIVGALDRFGKWSGLADNYSADHDEKYLNIPTLSLSQAEFQSEYVEFIGRETADRNFEPLADLSQSDYEILDMYNPDQIIPFMLIDGQFVQVGTGYSPQILLGLDPNAVRLEIKKDDSLIGKAIRMEIDNITALVCKSLKKGGAQPCADLSVKKLIEKI